MENIILYIVCGIINYVLIKLADSKKPSTWKDISFRFFMLLSGYIGTITLTCVGVLILIIRLMLKFDGINIPDPPKWL